MSIEQVKYIITLLLSSLLAMFHPLEDVMKGMLWLFVINGVIGLLADIFSGNKWSYKKACNFFIQCAVFFGVLLSLFAIGTYIHKHEEAMTCVSIISIIAVWVFSTNIFRNARNICTKGSSMYKFFDILYYVASVQVVEKIPFVQDYMIDKTIKEKEK